LKLKTVLECGSSLDNVGKLESPQCVRLNRVYFTIFRAKVWKILIFEWILFTLGAMAQATLEIENNREKYFYVGVPCLLT
jgi:hypothetical protein